MCIVYANLFEKFPFDTFEIQWNLVIKRSDIRKPSYNKTILQVQALYISLLFHPDMRNLIYNKVIFMVPKTSL